MDERKDHVVSPVLRDLDTKSLRPVFHIICIVGAWPPLSIKLSFFAFSETAAAKEAAATLTL